MHLHESDTQLLTFKEVEVRVKELLLSVTVNIPHHPNTL